MTQSLIEETRRNHERLGSVLRPLTERELIESMLLFGNNGSDENILLAAHRARSGFLSGINVPPAVEAKLLSLSASRPDEVESTRKWWNEIAESRNNWRKALQVVIGGTPAERDRLRKWAITVRSDTLVLIARFTGQSTTPEMRYATESIDAALAHVVLLLLDRKALKRLGGNVRQCALDQCDNFLLSVAAEGGGPRRRFCSNEHKETYLRLGNRARQERKRDRDRVAAKHK